MGIIVKAIGFTVIGLVVFYSMYALLLTSLQLMLWMHGWCLLFCVVYIWGHPCNWYSPVSRCCIYRMLCQHLSFHRIRNLRDISFQTDAKCDEKRGSSQEKSTIWFFDSVFDSVNSGVTSLVCECNDSGPGRMADTESWPNTSDIYSFRLHLNENVCQWAIPNIYIISSHCWYKER